MTARRNKVIGYWFSTNMLRQYGWPTNEGGALEPQEKTVAVYRFTVSGYTKRIPAKRDFVFPSGAAGAARGHIYEKSIYCA